MQQIHCLLVASLWLLQVAAFVPRAMHMRTESPQVSDLPQISFIPTYRVHLCGGADRQQRADNIEQFNGVLYQDIVALGEADATEAAITESMQRLLQLQGSQLLPTAAKPLVLAPLEVERLASSAALLTALDESSGLLVVAFGAPYCRKCR